MKRAYLAGWAGVAIVAASTVSFAQFSAGTSINVGNDMSSEVSVGPDAMKLTTEGGETFAVLTAYSLKFTVFKGAKVQIREAGGIFANLAWSKGTARVYEEAELEGRTITRELTYTDGTPKVTKCLVGGKTSDGRLTLAGGTPVNLLDPVELYRIRPAVAARSARLVIAIAGGAFVVVLAAIVMVRRRRRLARAVKSV